MAVSDFLRVFGQVPQAIGGAMDMLQSGLGAVQNSPLGQAVARGAVGASGGMPAVAAMSGVQAYAAEQQHSLYLQRQLQDELENAFHGQTFDPYNKEHSGTFLQIFGKYFPEKLPEAAANLHKLYAAQKKEPGQWRATAPNKAGQYIRYNQETGEVEQGQFEGGGGAPQAGLKELNTASEMAHRFTTSRPVMYYNDIRRNLGMIEAAYIDVKNSIARGERPNPQAFNAGVNSLAHIFDPGLGVRESDFTNVAEMQSIMDRIRNTETKWRSGGTGPETLKLLLDEARVLGKAAAEGIKPQIDAYRETARRGSAMSGLHEDDFLTGVPDVNADLTSLNQEHDSAYPKTIEIPGHGMVEAPPGRRWTGRKNALGQWETVAE